ncbi:hypothetical protein A2368_04805 [Candidatus Collierbacteria bacterium RIFOXYB1_FULL_49_13]|uniref:Uncharacterized protein n=1 Tax=Candidatus Collierbacteria bacterium RIFOXYB1_FULL_49_13 TaxID=1817728 RepID=A0A1F5FFF4_9BACT|nr:MAG: hypothetical protein A2368_04805 [Candidatus Collierbacteria bacterium RIFOXYB1_FULL_49_13]
MLSNEMLKALEPGRILMYNAGQGEYNIEATVKVLTTGTQGAMVKIERIIAHGKEVRLKVGDEIVASATELGEDD